MYFSGQNGRLEISDADASTFTEVGRIRNWSYSSQQATIDTTCLKDTDKTLIGGVRSLTGQASLLYYEEATSNIDLITRHLIAVGDQSYQSPNFGFVANGNQAASPSLCRIRLSLADGQTAKTRAIAMFACITSFSLTCSVGEVVSAEIAWEGHGAPFEFQY